MTVEQDKEQSPKGAMLHCPYCSWRQIVQGVLVDRIFKTWQFNFKCANCETSWEMSEVR